MARYIYQLTDWPRLTWDNEAIISLLSEVRNKQGRLTGKMEAIGFTIQDQALLETLSQDILTSSEIEGEYLNTTQVRSSIARKLGVDIGGMVESSREVEGVVEMTLDATQHCDQELTRDRLFSWHAALFPTGRSGMYKIQVGQWRDDSTGPMQVVSGPMGKETVHFQAPPADCLQHEMDLFLDWLNAGHTTDPVIDAAIAHLWFVTIHPFDDGNGRIARAITDMMLCRSENKARRFYSMSSQINEHRKDYYDILEKTQKGSLDITSWIVWFLECLEKAIDASASTVKNILAKHSFWYKHRADTFNDRQTKMIDLLFGNFHGKLTTSKWAKINKCSTDTALRDIQDLVDKDVLHRSDSGGRSTHYELLL